uniref:Uncharacterized protein n=1 Tax=Oryza glumipatula TaxID=40148 RepID=A0A0E0AIP0_9ORYZ
MACVWSLPEERHVVKPEIQSIIKFVKPEIQFIINLTFQLWPPPSSACSRPPSTLLELGSKIGTASLALGVVLPVAITKDPLGPVLEQCLDIPTTLPNLRHNASLNTPLLDSHGRFVSVLALPYWDTVTMEVLAVGHLPQTSSPTTSSFPASKLEERR